MRICFGADIVWCPLSRRQRPARRLSYDYGLGLASTGVPHPHRALGPAGALHSRVRNERATSWVWAPSNMSPRVLVAAPEQRNCPTQLPAPASLSTAERVLGTRI